MKMKVLVIDLNKCQGCHNCEEACKDEHLGKEWFPYSKPQPNSGDFWHKVIGLKRKRKSNEKIASMHIICQHCDEAPCIRACPQGAIYKRVDGIVLIEPNTCSGSMACLSACPYGAIYFNYYLNISQKCTMCVHRLSKGYRKPRCVEACPSEALIFGEDWQLKELIGDAEVFHPEYKVKPRVYYIGLAEHSIKGSISYIKRRKAARAL